MDGSIWDCCPADINAVERKNQDSEDIAPQQLQSAMINPKANSYMCAIAYCSHGWNFNYMSCEGHKRAAESRCKHRSKKYENDPNAIHSPPGHQSHFKQLTSTKRYYTSNVAKLPSNCL